MALQEKKWIEKKKSFFIKKKKLISREQCIDCKQGKAGSAIIHVSMMSIRVEVDYTIKELVISASGAPSKNVIAVMTFLTGPSAHHAILIIRMF